MIKYPNPLGELPVQFNCVENKLLETLYKKYG